MEKHIFIIDDDEEILTLLQFGLSRANYNVRTARNHRELFAHIESGYLPDIFIIDYYLPEVDGISLSKELLTRNIKKPVFLFTAADSDVINISECPENIVDIIRKPFSFDDIIEKINKIERAIGFYASELADKKTGRVIMSDHTYSVRAADLTAFFGKISHKMKNSLQSITNYVELLKKGYVDKADEERVFNSILKKIDEIKHEIDILKHPQDYYQEEKFSLKTVIKLALSGLKTQIKEKDIYIKTSYQKNLPLCFGKRGLLYELFFNLFEKIVYCSQKSSSLEISVFCQADEYLITIIQSRIEPACQNLSEFFNLTLKDENAISFTRSILGLKNMDGKIEINLDELGRGSYKITLPFNAHVSD